MRHKAWYHKKTSPAVLTKTAIMIITTVMLFLPKFTFQGHGGLIGHCLFPFSHANVFHLAANILCLYMIRFPFSFAQAFAVSFIASFIPAPTFQYSTMSFADLPTCGLSGVIFAAVAQRYAQCTTFTVTLKYLILPAFIASLLPNVNMLFHLYCIFIAFAVTRIASHLKTQTT